CSSSSCPTSRLPSTRRGSRTPSPAEVIDAESSVCDRKLEMCPELSVADGAVGGSSKQRACELERAPHRHCDAGPHRTPEQIRTAVTALRGRRPRPLDDGGSEQLTWSRLRMMSAGLPGLEPRLNEPESL